MTNVNYLELPSLDLSHDEISIAFWIQVDLDTTLKTSWNRIFRLHNSNSKTISCGFYRDYRPGSVYFFVGNGNSPSTYSQVDENQNQEGSGVGDANTAEIILLNHQWYHIAWSMSASRKEWHIDVSGIGNFSFTGMLTHEQNVYHENILNSKTGKNFVGFIDNFQMFTEVFDKEQVASIREKGAICRIASVPLCEACTPGFFSADGTTCEPCAPGSISTQFNATGCEPCSAGSTSFRGTSTCFDTAVYLAATGCVCGAS